MRFGALALETASATATRPARSVPGLDFVVTNNLQLDLRNEGRDCAEYREQRRCDNNGAARDSADCQRHIENNIPLRIDQSNSSHPALRRQPLYERDELVARHLQLFGPGSSLGGFRLRDVAECRCGFVKL